MERYIEKSLEYTFVGSNTIDGANPEKSRNLKKSCSIGKIIGRLNKIPPLIS